MTLAVSLSDPPTNNWTECKHPLILSFIQITFPRLGRTETSWTLPVGDNLPNATPAPLRVSGGLLTLIPLFHTYDTGIKS